MIKNIGKLKQWTGERFGNVKTTLQTEDFQRLEVETERKRIAYEKLHAAAGITQIQLAKKKVSPEDNKSKRLPNDILGVCLTNYGNEFTDDAPLGVALINFGQAQSKLGSYQEDFADVMKNNYLEKLEEGLAMFKEYSNLRKKLESRRLDYDSKLVRLQKSKKEKPELEQEMQASKMKYEDSEYDVIQKMAQLQEFEDEHCEAIQHFLELQYEYFNRSLEALNEVRSTWGQPMSTSNAPPRHTNRLNALSRTSSNNSTSTGDDYSRSPRLTSAVSRKGSTADISTVPARRLQNQRSLSFSDREENSTPSSQRVMGAPFPPPVLPRRQSQASVQSTSTTQRKAIYDFGGDNADELSFRTGEMITVIEEVDEGWWLGEITESGQLRRGIFPVNYTELVVVSSSHMSAGPPMPARPNLSSTTSHPGYIAEHPEEYDVVDEPLDYEPSPFGDAHRMTRPNQPTRTLSANTSSSPSPMNSPIPRQNTTTKRAPPPPPVSRTPPVMSSRSSNTSIKPTARTAPSTPQIHVTQSNHYFETATTTASCGECGCEDFTANIFKKGHCNNCFHKH